MVVLLQYNLFSKNAAHFCHILEGVILSFSR